MAVFTGNQTLQRITLVTDETLEKDVVEQVTRLGADSYICTYCSGKPSYLAVEKLASRCSLVRIEVLAHSEEADAIMRYINHLQIRNYPVTAVMDCVTANV